ncbi:STAS domain-containing protein [Actinacidiphila paucisporea]|uniref:RsbT co-antagonist protein RsbR n=1 Tax=Actinacidiphila paucisporea TaxID=310782 RepID=A0A1M7FTE7_9ACTN|nr:STAS domain-containing protein [Actinacidiphila paucisporea]SHM07195.1 rsbT co-antagonist protein RsbR [Actinacidiphila paucisporea]
MAQDDSDRLLSLLADGQDDFVARWIRTVTSSLAGRLTPAEVQQDLTELYRALLVALRQGDTATKGEAFGEVRSLLTELSRNRARQGFSPTETASSLFALKEVLQSALVEAGDLATYARFCRVLDDLGLYTVEVHAKAREEIISAQAEQLLELSTPVVKLWDGIVGVPLVGTLDSARTQVVMEKLLQSLLDQNATHAIVDITGVPSVDTQVAQHLLKTVVAARMMGAECTISGIRPQIAQTIVALGIEFGDITTKATLADALRHALHRIEQNGAAAGIGGTA